MLSYLGEVSPRPDTVNGVNISRSTGELERLLKVASIWLIEWSETCTNRYAAAVKSSCLKGSYVGCQYLYKRFLKSRGYILRVLLYRDVCCYIRNSLLLQKQIFLDGTAALIYLSQRPSENLFACHSRKQPARLSSELAGCAGVGAGDLHHKGYVHEPANTAKSPSSALKKKSFLSVTLRERHAKPISGRMLR